MEDDFVKNIISLLNCSDIRLKSIDIIDLVLEDNNRAFARTIKNFVSYEEAPLSNTTVIPCLIIFTLFDAFLERGNKALLGASFRKKYNMLPSVTNEDIIKKECFRLIKTIRNGYVHSMSAITYTNNLIRFKYITPQKTKFNLEITLEKMQLLYTIIVLLVKGKCDIGTKGHYYNLISTYYSELKNYIDECGKFSDDIKTAALSGLESIPNFIKLKTVLRYFFKNPKYIEYKDEYEDEIKIKIKIISEYQIERKDYSIDYFIKYKNKEYIIPKEILDKNSSVLISDLAIWELNK